MTTSQTDIRKSAYSMWKWVGHIVIYAFIFSYSSAYAADSTFLLQLGTFPTEAAAVKKWDDVKAKNSDVVGSLTLHVAEVVIPPDNTINYRTQAGPISTHAQAASLCSSLQSRSIDCNIVETALFTEAVPPSTPSDTTAVAAAVAAPVVAENATTAIASPPAASETAAASPPKTHWWNSLFSSKSSSEPTPAAPSEPVSTAITPVVAEPIAATPAPAPTPEVVATAPVSSQPAAAAPVSVFSPPAPVETATVAAPIAAAPTSQAPTSQVVPGRELKFLDAQPISSSPPPPTIMSENTAPLPSSSASSSANIGKVNVAEAIHVPLSDANKKRSFKVVNGLPAVSGKGGTPSSISAKLLWAQISYFSSDDEARHFYSDLTTTYPQFADDTRVRITHPYSTSNNNKVSLRIGPFASISDIHTVCAGVHSNSDANLHCTLVRDLSNSTAAHVTRERPNFGTNYENRTANYAATNDGPAPAEETSTASAEKSWVQFGSFATPDMAWDSWNTLKENHKKLLKKVQATVTTPTSSSASRALFRLRAGPFPSEAAANILCDKLSAEGEGCIVLNDQ